jgi:predicted metalloprotease with PDZ domain
MANDLRDFFGEAAHEYVHAWNLMRIRPAEYGDVSYVTPPRSRGLWWAEGATMYLADLMLRRAGLPVFDSSRTAHLESLIARYLGQPGNARFSPESVSVVSYGGALNALGDYDASTHLQGQLIATLLDLRVRDATNGRRSLADVLRLMLERFSGERGYATQDIAQAVADVCGCSTERFFDQYVRSAHALDFDGDLAAAGLRTRVTHEPALDRSGRPFTDLRVYARPLPGESLPALRITRPDGAWGRAGLHTGDRIVALQGSHPRDWPAVRAVLTGLHLGDTVVVDVLRDGRPVRANLIVSGYDRPVVRLEEIAGATERQRDLRDRWRRGDW